VEGRIKEKGREESKATEYHTSLHFYINIITETAICK